MGRRKYEEESMMVKVGFSSWKNKESESFLNAFKRRSIFIQWRVLIGVEKGGKKNGEQKVQAERNSNVMRFLLSGSIFVLIFFFWIEQKISDNFEVEIKYLDKERSKTRNPETKRDTKFYSPLRKSDMIKTKNEFDKYSTRRNELTQTRRDCWNDVISPRLFARILRNPLWQQSSDSLDVFHAC